MHLMREWLAHARTHHVLSVPWAGCVLGARTASFVLLDERSETRSIFLHEPPTLSWAQLLQENKAPAVIGSMLFTRAAQYTIPWQRAHTTVLLLPSVVRERVVWHETRFARPTPFAYEAMLAAGLEAIRAKEHDRVRGVVGVRANGYAVGKSATGDVTSVAVGALEAHEQPEIATLLKEIQTRYLPMQKFQVYTPAQIITTLSCAYLEKTKEIQALYWLWFDYDELRTFVWEGGVLDAVHSLPEGGLLAFMRQASKEVLRIGDFGFWSDLRHRLPREERQALSRSLAQWVGGWREALPGPWLEKSAIVIAPSLFWGRLFQQAFAEQSSYHPHDISHIVRPLLTDTQRVRLADIRREPPLYAAIAARLVGESVS